MARLGFLGLRLPRLRCVASLLSGVQGVDGVDDG